MLRNILEVWNSVETERLVTEGACLTIVFILSLGTVTFLDLAPLTTSLKSASPTQQSMTFISLVMGIYAMARIYFHFALVVCDKASAKLTASSEEAMAAKQEVIGEQHTITSTYTQPKSAWLWRSLCFLSVSVGLAFVYYCMPGGRTAIDSAVLRLVGDLPEIILKASEKDLDRMGKRGKKLLGLFVGYFFILYILEIALRGVVSVLRAVYRKLAGINSVALSEKINVDAACALPEESKHDVSASDPVSDAQGSDNEEGKQVLDDEVVSDAVSVN